MFPSRQIMTSCAIKTHPVIHIFSAVKARQVSLFLFAVDTATHSAMNKS